LLPSEIEELEESKSARQELLALKGELKHYMAPQSLSYEVPIKPQRA